MAVSIYIPTNSAKCSLFSTFSPVLNLLKQTNFLKDHLGYSVDHGLKGDKKRSKKTSQEAVVIIQERDECGSN